MQQEEFSQNIVTLLQRMGPFFQKIGQIMGSMSYMLPKTLTDTLKQFQEDNMVNITPYDEVQLTLRTHPLRDQLTHVNPDPIASGTVAQVHVGYMIDGTKVAIKITKKNIRDEFQKNIDDLNRIFGLLGWFTKKTRYLHHLVRIISENLVRQTDLSFEYQMIQEIAYNNRFVLADGKIRIPEVIGDPHPDILLMRFIEAQSCAQYDWSVLPDEKRKEIVDRLFRFVIDCITNDGIFHIDLHPGNVMYNKDTDEAYLIDFGLMGNNTGMVRRYYREVVAICTEKDYMEKYIDHIIRYLIITENPNGNMRRLRDGLREIIAGANASSNLIQISMSRRKLVDECGYEMAMLNNTFDIALLCAETTLKTIYPNYALAGLFGQSK